MAAVINGEEREIQKNYWVEHSVDLTVEAMMLDSMAADLDKEERPEVLSLLPSYEGKTVLELGAGIGRFTGELAKKAGKVIALDFIESVVKKNESNNGHFKNVEFLCADVTSPDLNFPDESIDLIFSNWLLMYLSDKEVEYLAERLLKWVKVGGCIFFRESCFHQSGDHKRKHNPTHYREPRFYTKVFKECHTSDGSGNSYELSLIGSKCIGAYVRSKKNQNQICWTWQKVVNADGDRGFQQFLDNVQYKSTGILRYERIFGHGFVSTGGIDTTKEFVAMLDLKPGQKVLDVGCGIGGGDFYMAENFDVDVVGIDLSVNMISFALERAIGLKCSVEFEVADCTTKHYPDNSFDVIYSRDTILHIQVLSFLPPYEGKSVLELGAGQGHFTGELAKKAGKVIALDSIESVVKENENINGHYENVEFMCADVTSPDLDFPSGTADLIFTYALLSNLSDKEVKATAEKLLKWVKVGGYIFFTEPCSHQSEDHKQKSNQEQIREPRFYTKVFKECHMSDASGSTYEFSLVETKSIGAYGDNKINDNQIFWIWQKVVKSEDDVDRGFQQFLDNVQYKSSGILRYERIFGYGFVSTGGIDTTKEFVAKLDLKPGQKVLDVGCGIGGGDFYMADKFGVEVVGIDLSVNMISLALERAIGLECTVAFEVADCTKKSYPDDTFDVIYSRDTILHIQDKPALFQTFHKWLKPGGKVLISDYCRKCGTPSEDFAEYIKQRGYDLHDVETYGGMLRDAGFGEVTAEDRTEQFKEVLTRELERVEKEKEEFIRDFSEEDYNDIVGSWKAKLVRVGSGEQRWGLFYAEKK